MKVGLIILMFSLGALLSESRRVSPSRKRVMKRKQGIFTVNEWVQSEGHPRAEDEFDFDGVIDTRFLDAISMSMSAAPTTVNAKPAQSSSPSVAPSFNQTTSSEPTSPQPISNFPTVAPSMNDSQPSMAPSLTNDGELTFECTDNGTIRLGNSSDYNTTAIFIFVGYLVESTTYSADDFLEELEDALLETAVNASLGCGNNDGRRGRFLNEGSRKLLLSHSVIIDSTSCETTLSEARSCHVIETDLVFFLKGEFDPDRVSYQAYTTISRRMTDGDYFGVGGTILKVEYLSPLPLPVPPQLRGEEGTNDTIFISSKGNRLGVSPWTIGACVASVFGGVVSLFVWTRNRRSRHQRHVELIEDTSFMDMTSRNPMSI